MKCACRFPAAACRGTSRRRAAGLQSAARHGLTLLEVLVSVAIFLGSLTVILQILNSGRDAELMARIETEAVMRCEAKMSEVIVGIEDAVSGGSQVFPDSEDGSWSWQLEVADSGISGLLKVTVTVERTVNGAQQTSLALIRYMRDPQMFIDAALSASGESE